MTTLVCISGIHLKRIGDRAVVAVEYNGQWVDVISERLDGQFSHIVEPNGIFAALSSNRGDKAS
jgi:hypothetical protein